MTYVAWILIIVVHSGQYGDRITTIQDISSLENCHVLRDVVRENWTTARCVAVRKVKP